MAIELLSAQNPWWADRSAIQQDRHLSEYYKAPIHWRPALLDEIRLDEDLIYIIRGPRQIGKTTSLKLLIEAMLQQDVDPRRICYLDCELAGIGNFKELVNIIDGHLNLIRRTINRDRVFLFLDEVTFIRDWAIGIKALADKGALINTTVIVTGSSSIDLKRGGERLPGRRGERTGLNKKLLPLTFKEYVFTFAPELKNKIPIISLLDSPKDFTQILFEASALSPQLVPFFEQYLLTGGFPRPINSFIKSRKIDDYVYELHRDAFIGEITRIGKKESYFRELVTWLAERHGKPIDWRDISRETDIGKHDTARDYAEDLELLFLWDIYFKSQDLHRPLPAFRSQKKIYFKDPFLFHIFWSWSQGAIDAWKTSLDYLRLSPNRASLVESIIAAHLRNKCGNDVFYWKPNHEVDFLISRGKKLYQLIEVKYQEKIRPENMKHLKKVGKGILVSKATLDQIKENILVVPAYLFLIML